MDFKLDSYEKTGKLAIRIILLVLLPFFLGAFVFPHTQYLTGTSIDAPTQNATQTSVSYSFAQSHNAAMDTAQINSVFPLAEYLDFPPFISHRNPQLCFLDNGSSLTLPNGTVLTPNFNWNISLSNGKSISLATNSVRCANLLSGEKLSYIWTASVLSSSELDGINGTVTFDPETSTFPRETMDYGLLQGLAMIPVFYLLVWYPLAGIWKKIRHGMLEQ